MFKALEISQRVIKNGPVGAKNFIHAYQFGVNKEGLDLSAPKSIEFAKNISDRSLKIE